MKNKKLFGEIAQLATVYTVGPVIGLSFQFLAWIKLVKIIHPENFFHFQGKKIFAANHPSLVEPLLLACLCWKGYLSHPLQLPPIGIVDRANLGKRDIYGGRWLWWIRRFVISVSRNGGNNKKSFKEMLAVLKTGRRIIIFPEGGRTSTGKEWAFSPSGHCIRKELTEGCTAIARLSGALIVPIWFHWDRTNNNRFPFRSLLLGRLTVVIGREFSVGMGEDRAEATLCLRNILLNLAEKNLKK